MNLSLSTAAVLHFKMALVSLFWGGTFIAGRHLATALPHLTAATGRFLIALAVLLALLIRLEGRLPRLSRAQLGVTFVLGASGVFLYNVFFFGALGHMEAGRTALFIAFNPIVTAVLGAWLLRDRLAWRQWIGVILALAGVLVLVSRGDPTVIFEQGLQTGELLIFGAVFSWAAYTLVGKLALKGLSPLAATTWAALWGCGLLGLGALWETAQAGWPAITLSHVAAMAYLGVFGTALGFVWYYQGVLALGPARAAVYNNLVPVWGVTLGILLLGERLLPSMLVGGVMVVLGVLITNRLIWSGGRA